ncbi:acyl carrier protein [Catellatospora bangladeshensis]|uniref:Carrier domain-containing protein n=1 Tax=Catellatospora bangladeshensis TaxID=310355 RepID=A0A8J3JRH7_9ACTN|nr:acyl carrier protein [Catellatospora bangladeshensis]GIF85606.1 hypothetical protein Cba03nite_69550 [Catellatospora bangladeshensis]
MLLQEQKVSQVWAKVIGIDVSEVDADTNFFDLGGTSLMLIELVDELNTALGIETDILTLLEFPTIEDFVSQWNARHSGAAS